MDVARELCAPSYDNKTEKFLDFWHRSTLLEGGSVTADSFLVLACLGWLLEVRWAYNLNGICKRV